MSTPEIAKLVMDLPEKDQLELARQIVANIATEQETARQISRAVKGIEDVVTGKVPGLSEAEFRDALR